MSSQKWTVSQAAQTLGVSEKTVYRHIKSGKLKAKIEGAASLVEEIAAIAKAIIFAIPR